MVRIVHKSWMYRGELCNFRKRTCVLVLCAFYKTCLIYIHGDSISKGFSSWISSVLCVGMLLHAPPPKLMLYLAHVHLYFCKSVEVCIVFFVFVVLLLLLALPTYLPTYL